MEFFKFNVLQFTNEILLPCILSCILGGIIGLQRERADRPAGLRTHTLVCLGATVFTLVSYLGFTSYPNPDPSRIAAGVVTGIGFIGAGAIFRLGSTVKGITTAASIWIVAAIGLALGTRLYYLALLGTLLGFLILSLVKYFEDKFLKASKYILTITAKKNFAEFDEIIDILKKISTDVCYREYKVDKEKDKLTIVLSAQSNNPEFSSKVLEHLKNFENIEGILIS
ncbi:MAG: MgtC/SapB family protein [Actinobacteria bacterium]|nr:MgtC/SapB family protein [Actinomycetota bacterium]